MNWTWVVVILIVADATMAIVKGDTGTGYGLLAGVIICIAGVAEGVKKAS